MSLWRTFKVAWEGLTLNKARSFLTTLGVISTSIASIPICSKLLCPVCRIHSWSFSGKLARRLSSALFRPLV